MILVVYPFPGVSLPRVFERWRRFREVEFVEFFKQSTSGRVQDVLVKVGRRPFAFELVEFRVSGTELFTEPDGFTKRISVLGAIPVIPFENVPVLISGGFSYLLPVPTANCSPVFVRKRNKVTFIPEFLSASGHGHQPESEPGYVIGKWSGELGTFWDWNRIIFMAVSVILCYHGF
jgi:hypothetical protein